ncbi:O-antigen ligase family protein [Candidatus Pelagibacter sp.]|nr:O-antigen ligase family protein [Candidatus Pelagibacter sp.]
MSGLFLFCLKDKNYNLHFKNFYNRNKTPISFYLLFLTFLFFQILPLPIEFLKFFSPEKYKYIINLRTDSAYSTITLSPSNSYFQILHFISLIILVFILKMIFYTNRHKNRFYLFLSLIGFVASLFAVIFYLNGNPDFFIFKKFYYKNAATGFFINRTVFAVFLLFSLIANLELIKNIESQRSNKKKDNFFFKIYIRLFIIFITIGIIASFSRIGNFLLLITILFYLVNEYFFSKNHNRSFRNVILLIVLFDIFIMGFYFGANELIDRFLLLKDEFSQISAINSNLSRAQIFSFALNQFYNFFLFGYGPGSFETLFQINFKDSGNAYANHAHSDITEFIGEFGLIGMILLISSIFKLFCNKIFYTFNNYLLIICLIVILIFDFSLHIPIIQFLFIIFFCLRSKKL